MSNPKAYEGSAPYVFIAYDISDEKTVVPVVSALVAHGINVWYKGGCDIAPDLERSAERLNSCSAYIIFMSQAAHDSPYCRMELNQVVSIVREPIIVYLEDVAMSLGMMMQLSTAYSINYNEMNSEKALLSELLKCEDIKNLDAATPMDRQSRLGTDQFREREQLFSEGKDRYSRGDKHVGISMIENAAKMGHAEAYYFIGTTHDNFVSYSPKNAEAYKWYEKAAELGHARSQYLLGRSIRYGTYHATDEELGLKWMRRAAEQGHAEAQYLCYLWLPSKSEEGLRYLNLAADQENTDAQRSLGSHYDSKDDKETALYWYTRASENGDQESTIRIGHIFASKNFIHRDVRKAEEAFLNAAANSWGATASSANLALAELYLNEPKLQKRQKAIEILKKEAANGSFMAQTKLEKLGILMF